MGMGITARLELLVWALAQVTCYGVTALAAVALFTRPRQAAVLLFGERGLRVAARVFGPAAAALDQSAAGQSASRSVESMRVWTDAQVERLLGTRDVAAADRVWGNTVASAEAHTAEAEGR